jgi:putative polyhydroxyalkanoate system protein
MPRISVTVPHSLGKEAAGQRVSHVIDELKDRYGGEVDDLEESITGDTRRFAFSARGFRITGQMMVRDSEVRFECQLPLVAAPFQGRVKSEVKARLEALLA